MVGSFSLWLAVGLFVALVACAAAAVVRTARPEDPAGDSPSRRWLAALAGAGAFCVVLAATLMTIDRFAFSRPYWDQWGEALGLFKPFREGTLPWSVIVEPHSEHRIALTRLMALALFELDGFWDNRVPATVNALLHALSAGLISFALVRSFELRFSLPAAIALVALWGAPLAREIIVLGFESQFYFVLLLAPIAIWLLTQSAPRSVGFWLGGACGALALISLGNGVLAVCALLAVAAAEGLRVSETRRERRPLIAVVAALLLAGLLLRKSGNDPSLYAHTLGDFLTSAARVAAYPFHAPAASLFVWAPWAAWLLRRLLLRTPWSGFERLTASLGLFVLLHAPAVAFARGAGGAGPATRYFDFLSLGLVANLLALLSLVEARDGTWRRAVAFGWTAVVAYGALRLALQMGQVELPLVRGASFRQDNRLAAFLRTGDPESLHVTVRSDLPYSEPERLRRTMTVPFVREVLPGHLHGTLAVEQLEADDSAFGPGGPPESALAEAPLFSNWHRFFTHRTGRFQGRVAASAQPYLQLRLTGYFAPSAQSLALIGEGERIDVPLPRRSPGNGWIPVTVRAPRGPFTIEASGTRRDLWWGFTAPAEVGPLTGLAEWLLRQSGALLGFGAALWLAALALAFEERRASRAQRNSSASPPLPMR